MEYNTKPNRGSEYQREFYIPANGISREVITTDICLYLGPNARVVSPNYDTEVYIHLFQHRPETCADTGSREGLSGIPTGRIGCLHMWVHAVLDEMPLDWCL